MPYSKEEFINAVNTSKSIASVIKKIGLIPAGGNYMTVKTKIQEYNLDTSHFTGNGWNKGNYLPLSSLKSTASLKKNIIRERGNQCENCFNNYWFDEPITLELEHIDGNRFNNSLINLKLLCPNCHSYTSTWRRNKNCLINGTDGGG